MAYGPAPGFHAGIVKLCVPLQKLCLVLHSVHQSGAGRLVPIIGSSDRQLATELFGERFRSFISISSLYAPDL
jgi:hypothetical protein